MKNKKFKVLIYLFINLFFSSNLYSTEIFNFEFNDIEITQNGNFFRGYNGGKILSEDGISIIAKKFEFNKNTNFLYATGNVKFLDSKRNIEINSGAVSYSKDEEIIIARDNVKIYEKEEDILIYANEISYLKKEEKINAYENVKLEDNLKKLIIRANEISFDKINETIVAKNKVNLDDKINDVQIVAEKISYLKKDDKIFTEGVTDASVYSKYNFSSKDVTFLKSEMRIYSNEQTTITDLKNSLYKLSEFDYQISKEFLKGTDVTVIEDITVGDGKSDKYFFANGFFDLKNKKYKSGETKISLKRNIFDRSNNDPRLFGASSNYENGITTVNKAVFTSCEITGNCPPWRIEASKIKHDKNKKQLIYENSVLKFYDLPIFYFPKFFHPDPTVKRQSGFLLPSLNNSNILGSSISAPYFHVISINKDVTINPIIFSKNTKMIQSEYREKNKNSDFVADFGFVNNFKSSSTNESKNINHLFAKFKKNLGLINFNQSDLEIFFERVTKDTYLKIFSDNLSESNIKPSNPDILKSGLDLVLENEQFSLSGGVNIYEDLTKLQSDRYQFVFPYYNFSNTPVSTKFGSLNLNSSGNNILDNTNNLKSRIINDISFSFNDKIFENIGLKNNINFYFKNLNSIGRNVNTYKSSPQIEIQSLIELNSELPLSKITESKYQTLIPRLSLRVNPSDMKNHSDQERKINTDNIFNINRIGISDSLEAGNSLTLGIDYKNQDINNNDEFFELKLATVFRDEEENNIPSQTTLNNKNSNIFGSIKYNANEYINVDYNFAIDNKIDNFKYNSIGLGLSVNNFITKFNFIEEDSDLGNTNVFENNTEYNFNKNNSILFKTRRNRELNLTEYYDLVYEYKNDCLTAGIKFNKTYYEDRDLKPSENLMFTISFYPLTTIEQKIE